MLNAVLLLGCFGFAGLFVIPAALSSTRWGSKIGNAYARFIAFALRRPALTVGKRSDLTLRQLSYDDVFSAEEFEAGGVMRKVRRPAENVHRLGSTPLAFVDEEYGVTFDLRDLLLSEKALSLREDGQLVRTYSVFEDGTPTRVEHFFRAFLEIAERRAMALDLDDSVRPWVDGSEKAHLHERMDEAVRRMFIDRQEDLSFFKLLVPMIGIGAGLLLGFYIVGPGQLPGEPVSSSPIDVGAIGLVSLTSGRQWLSVQASRVRETLGSGAGGDDGLNIPWWRIGKALVATGVLAITAGIAIKIGMFWSAVIGGSFLAGFAFLPLLLLVFGALGAGAGLGDLMLMAALMGFDEPVINLRADDRYEIREADALGLEDPPKVKVAWTLVGLSCDVDPEAFDGAGATAADLEDVRDQFAADGGRDADECLPTGFESTREIQKAGHHAYLPTNPSTRSTFVRLDMFLARFRDAATGGLLDVAEKEARKQYAAGDPDLSDQRLMVLSLAGTVLGFLLSAGVFALV